MKSVLLSTLKVFFAIFLLSSCKKLKNDIELAELTTNPVQVVAGNIVILGGNISNKGGSAIFKRGVCWNKTDNPTRLDNNFLEDYYDTDGDFSFQTNINNLEPNTQYYVRAYCENEKGIQYGNTLNFLTGEVVSTSIVHDIETDNALLRGQVYQENSSASARVGFVYSTSPNPTVNNMTVLTDIVGSAPYEINVLNLLPNTTYYVRAYINLNFNGDVFYGQQQQFKTTGYFGPAGGYVAFDKGETIDGWRYLEIHPTTLNYDISWSNGAAWGNNSSFLSGTLSQFGMGLANTSLISSNLTDANCAAKLCNNLSLNGYTDWFLPSSEELLLVSNSLRRAGYSVGGYAWTSTQYDANQAMTCDYNSTLSTYQIFPRDKFLNLNVYPVRRY